MEIILLEKIENLGVMGDKVNVKSGYGRNYLIPQGKATPATEENIAEYEARRVDLEKIAAEALTVAEARRDKLADMTLNIKANAGEEGKLFGSVGTSEIIAAIAASGAEVEVEKHEVRLPEGAFHQIGEYEVELHLHADVNVTVKLVIEAE